jgi:hypothetical protein
MPKADTEHTTAPLSGAPKNCVRRRLLAGATAVLAAGAAIATTARAAPVAPAEAAGGDAELIRLCTEYHRQHDVAYAPTCDGWEDALDATWELTDEIAVIPATTEEGRRAKAAVAARLFAVEDRGDTDCQFVQAILRDLAGQRAGFAGRTSA